MFVFAETLEGGLLSKHGLVRIVFGIEGFVVVVVVVFVECVVVSVVLSFEDEENEK